MTYNQLEVCLTIIDEAIEHLEEEHAEEAMAALLVAREKILDLIVPAEENPLDFNRVMADMGVLYPSDDEPVDDEDPYDQANKNWN